MPSVLATTGWGKIDKKLPSWGVEDWVLLNSPI